MRLTVLFTTALILSPVALVAAEFRTVTSETVTAWIRNRRPVAVIDLQSKVEFREHHFDGAISAAGAPAKLDRLARRLSRSKGEVVVVTEKGDGEATQAAARLTALGVSPTRIAILEKGMEGAVAHTACDCCKAPEGSEK